MHHIQDVQPVHEYLAPLDDPSSKDAWYSGTLWEQAPVYPFPRLLNKMPPCFQLMEKGHKPWF